MNTTKTILLSLACLTLLVCATLGRPAEEEYDYEDEPEVKPSSTAAPARHSPLLRRGPNIRPNPLSKTTTTTTTTPPPPKPEENETPADEAEYADGEELDNEAVTTTEASKKLRSGVIRPFRSNVDLLEALKRRREQASSGKSHTPKAAAAEDNSQHEAAVAAPTPKKSSGRIDNKQALGRKRFSGSSSRTPAPAAQELDETPEPAPTPRSSRGRFAGRAAPRSHHHSDVDFQGSETNQESVEVQKPRYRPRSRQ